MANSGERLYLLLVLFLLHLLRLLALLHLLKMLLFLSSRGFLLLFLLNLLFLLFGTRPGTASNASVARLPLAAGALCMRGEKKEERKREERMYVYQSRLYKSEGGKKR